MDPSSFKREIRIGERRVGPQQPAFIIAEAGVSHFGSRDAALRLVDAAADAAADAVKFQIFSTERLISREAPEWIERLRDREMSLSDYAEVKRYAEHRGLIFFATAHDEASLDEIASLDVQVFKVGSGEVRNPPYFHKVGGLGRPVIFSTGLATKEDILATLGWLQTAGCTEVAVLHCVTAYPTPPAEANLRCIRTLQDLFPGPVGYSDHSVTQDIAASSVLYGASIIERHITLQKDIPNAQDWKVSCTPNELREFVASIRRLEAARGDGVLGVARSAEKAMDWARKSIVAARAIPAGTAITAEDLVCKRPGTGIPPTDLGDVIGKTSTRPIEADALLRPEWLRDSR